MSPPKPLVDSSCPVLHVPIDCTANTLIRQSSLCALLTCAYIDFHTSAYIFLCILEDGDEIKFNSVSILLSRMKWNFLHHGAWHCLQYRNESDGTFYCINDDEYLSVRYITIQDVSGTVLGNLWTRTWSIWLISDRGKLLLFSHWICGNRNRLTGSL